MLRSLRSLLCLLSAAVAMKADTITINFEGFAAGTVITNQYSGLYFTNAQITSPSPLSAYPTHSGVNSLTQVGGAGVIAPMEIDFSTPMSSVSAYFDAPPGVTVNAYDQYYDLLATTTLTANEVSANTNVAVNAPSGISRVQIFTPGGTTPDGSFTLDDLTFTSAVPEIDAGSGAGALACLAGALLIFQRQKKQSG